MDNGNKPPPMRPTRHEGIQGLKYLFWRYVAGRSFLVGRASFYDLRFKFKTEDVIGRHIYVRGGIERIVTDFLVNHLRLEEDDVFLDVGANIGWYSLIIGKQNPGNVRIYAFEPDPLNYSLLTENIRLNASKNVTAVNQAVSDKEETAVLYRYPPKNLGRHSMLPISGAGGTEVPTTTLDAFWKKQAVGNRRPGFIKIDVEGYENHVLRGATEVLRVCPMLLAEFSPGLMKRFGEDPSEYLDRLQAPGFMPYLVTPQGPIPADTKALIAGGKVRNLLWLKEKWTEKNR